MGTPKDAQTQLRQKVVLTAMKFWTNLGKHRKAGFGKCFYHVRP